MSILKNENLKNLAKLISFYLFKTYESSKNKKIIKSTETFLPKEKKKFLLLLLNSNLLYVGSVGVLSGAILKDVLDLSHPNQDLKKSPRDLANQNKNLLDLANQNKNLPKLPLNIPFFEKQPEKRILALHLGYPVCSQNSINKYVIFKQKNKNNLSSVHINRGEVGKIIKKLNEWDYCLIDFSIKIPSRLKRLNTKSIAEKALNKTAKNEAIFILEKTQTKKKFIFF